MSQLPRQLLLHVAAGFAVAALFVLALVVSDAGAVLRAAEPGPLVLLWLFCGTTFAAALGATALAMPERRGRSAVFARVRARLGR